MKNLTLILLLAIATPLAPQAKAQQSNKNRYEEPSRFPVLRKAFRQIRSDVRFHAKTLRETASDIRHDVSSTIRNETSPQYGYRGDQTYNSRPQPVPAYEEYYEEPPIYTPQPKPRRQIERRDFEPKIVAPKPQAAPASNIEPKQPAWMDHPRVKKPAPRIETKSTPKPKPKPKADVKSVSKPLPKPKPEPKLDPKPEPKPEVVKKDKVYPVAKRSDRPGFHHSPFPPYELLDTQDIKPGGLAKDPGNGKIFRIPK